MSARPRAPAGADAGGAAAGRLARVHLRTGLLRLARVELEVLAGEDGLDTDGVLDLAEARWRTGDLRGAAEAAGVWLEAGTGASGLAAAAGRALAHAVIAEGLTVRGRHDDAAVHVAASLDALESGPAAPVSTALDALFAGIAPRADAWPSFGPDDPGPGEAGSATVDVHGPRVFSQPADPAAPDPIAAAGERLGAGDDAAGAVLLVLALRATPSRAEEVLERADAALAARPGAALLLARAEALRALGRHEAAGIAYAVAGTHARGGAAAPPPAPGTGAVDPSDVRGPASDVAAAPDPRWSPP